MSRGTGRRHSPGDENSDPRRAHPAEPDAAAAIPLTDDSGLAIDVRELVKSFDAVPALNALSLEVPVGEVFAFVGPNGAGKSTLISILCTLMSATSGSARVMGFDVEKERDLVRQHIGVVFQETTLDLQLTAEENLRFHCVMYDVPRQERDERIARALASARLESRGDDLVGSFSGGMARRLEVARALLHTPSVLFLDEPTLGLDPQTRAVMWDDLLAWCRERSVTVFLTTHYMEEAELADRVGIIDRGQMSCIGSPQELKARLGADVVELGVGDLATAREVAVRLVTAGYSVELTEDAPMVRATVSDGAAAVAALVLAAEADIAGVRVHSPTLDDVFLHHTGRALREGAPTRLSRAHLEKGGQYR